MKFRYALLVVCILYVLYVSAMLILDILYIDNVASNVQRTVATAAEQALTQVVASDEMFNATTNSIYDSNGVTTICIADNNSNTYTKANLFELVYKTTDKNELYCKMYGSDSIFNNSQYMSEVVKVTQTIGDIEIPLIARMGLLDTRYNLIPQSANILQNKLESSGYIASKQKFSSDWLGTETIEKRYASSSTEYTYYLAPTNIGITYIDPNLLETAFVSNMDLIMRSAVANDNLNMRNGVLNTEVKGIDYTVTEEAQDYAKTLNIINNGMYSFVKGQRELYQIGVGYTGGKTITGDNIKPVIKYKVIDMCDIRNEDIIRLAVTDAVGTHSSSDYYTWLSTLGIDTTKPYYCVVAQVTFYADIIVPYYTLFTRNLYSLYAREAKQAISTETDFFAIDIDNVENVTDTQKSAITGNPLYTYTTYFAVVP